MKVLVCPMCEWNAFFNVPLDTPEGAHAARRVLDMHFNIHCEQFREELEGESLC